MSSPKQMDDYYERAFGLAYFIQGSRAQAVSIVIESLGKLEVAASAQFKRLYYTPARRNASRPALRAETHRTKVSLSELHLLQRLIYIEAETYEREQEEARGALTEEALVIHFIKHLVRITLKRNSFYVTLGISRLLHNYTTAETMEIYNVAVQDPERVKDDYYYRSRKSRLIQETKERFGELLTVCRGPRGEERFKTRANPQEYVALVEECLSRFSPWDTPCSVPEAFDPLTEELRSLSCARQDEEDRVEINRIHAILHPSCYGRITKALKMDLPELRLDIPYFSLKDGENDMNRREKTSRRSPAPLSMEELNAIKTALGEQSARRSTMHAGLLSMRVDGAERARLDLRRKGKVRLAIEEGDELIEVRALADGRETLLATHLIDRSRRADASVQLKSEVVLEGGQKLSFLLSPAERETEGAGQFELTIEYQETRWLPAARLFAERTAQSLADRYGYEIRPERAVLGLALGALALMLCAGVLALLLSSRPSRILPVREAVQLKPPAVRVRPRAAAPQLPESEERLSHGSGGWAQNSLKRRTVSGAGPSNTEKKSLPEKIEQRKPVELPVGPTRPSPEQSPSGGPTDSPALRH